MSWHPDNLIEKLKKLFFLIFYDFLSNYRDAAHRYTIMYFQHTV